MTEHQKEYARQWRKRNREKIKQYRLSTAIRAYLAEVEKERCMTNDAAKDGCNTGQVSIPG